MRLIREAESLRYICDTIACCEAALCRPKPLLQVVSVGWHSNRSCKHTSEMKAVESDCVGQFCQSNVAGTMLGQIFHRTPDRVLVANVTPGPRRRLYVAHEEAIESRQKQLLPFECR